MQRHHYLYGRTTYPTQPDVLEHLRAIHRQHAAAQANNIGLLHPEGTGSWTHPNLDRVVHVDGKIITALFRARPGDRIVNKHTGEIRYPRADADAAVQLEPVIETDDPASPLMWYSLQDEGSDP